MKNCRGDGGVSGRTKMRVGEHAAVLGSAVLGMCQWVSR